ncbi:hypothetical protein [Candidatus Kuenenia sp.]|uniref:hypothetical protein n=1 Tax=Candidatus Kuenenia sp. TaxID=2499824 RepID=UPI0032201264
MFILFTRRICGQEFSIGILERICKVIAEMPGISRRALSRKVCEWLNWCSSNGKLQEWNCRKALNKLHATRHTEPSCGRKHRQFSAGKATFGHEGNGSNDRADKKT